MSGLNQTVILFLFLATAPIGLMPSVIAIATRQNHRIAVLCANLFLWTMVYWGARNFTIPGSSGYRIPTYVGLALWLLLFGFAIRNTSNSKKRAQA